MPPPEEMAGDLPVEQRAQILVVDDEPRNLQLLGTLLRKGGYRVRFAGAGATCLASAREQAPDLILLDIMMPGMDGYEVCRALKEDPATRDIPVIFLTAKAQTEEVVDAFKAGGVDFVTKPFRARELLARVKTHVDLKNAREALQQANGELVRVNAELSTMNNNQMRFFSMIAHDLRSPFSGLRMFPQMLATRFDHMSREEIIAIAEDVENHVDHVHHFLEELLEWCLLQMGELEIRCALFDAREIVQNVFGVAATAAANKDIRLVNNVAPALEGYGDRRMVQTILQNLVSNAIKFTPRGGQVTVHARPEKHALLIQVEDTGVGIPEHLQANLFQLGRRASTRGTEDERGTGFGLTLTKQFIEQHGGSIWLESEVDRGTTITFSLPYEPAGGAEN
jgi:signal transduction histidine kinase